MTPTRTEISVARQLPRKASAGRSICSGADEKRPATVRHDTEGSAPAPRIPQGSAQSTATTRPALKRIPAPIGCPPLFPVRLAGYEAAVTMPG